MGHGHGNFFISILLKKVVFFRPYLLKYWVSSRFLHSSKKIPKKDAKIDPLGHKKLHNRARTEPGCVYWSAWAHGYKTAVGSKFLWLDNFSEDPWPPYYLFFLAVLGSFRTVQKRPKRVKNTTFFSKTRHFVSEMTGRGERGVALGGSTGRLLGRSTAVDPPPPYEILRIFGA